MKMLIVVDMLNDFLDPKGALYCGGFSRDIIPLIQEELLRARQNGDVVVFLCDSHSEDDPEFKRFPVHCVTGTWGAEIIPEFVPRENENLIYKTRYNGFYGTCLDVLVGGEIEEYTVVGVCTSICVMDTVGELANRDFRIRVPRECVSDFDLVQHEFALKRMQQLYGVSLA